MSAPDQYRLLEGDLDKFEGEWPSIPWTRHPGRPDGGLRLRDPELVN